jgi:hypothetical protein
MLYVRKRGIPYEPMCVSVGLRNDLSLQVYRLVQTGLVRVMTGAQTTLTMCSCFSSFYTSQYRNKVLSNTAQFILFNPFHYIAHVHVDGVRQYEMRPTDDMSMEPCWNDTGSGNLEVVHKHVPAPLCPPHIPHGLNRARTKVSGVKDHQLNACIMAWPHRTQNSRSSFAANNLCSWCSVIN